MNVFYTSMKYFFVNPLRILKSNKVIVVFNRRFTSKLNSIDTRFIKLDTTSKTLDTSKILN